jgi:hypothetical protein
MTLSIMAERYAVSYMLSVTYKPFILSVVMVSVVMLSVVMLSVCRYAECHYAECRYTECRYAECRGAILVGKMDTSNIVQTL